MRRTEQAQGLRLMKFEDVYGRTLGGALGQGGVLTCCARRKRAPAVRRPADGQFEEGTPRRVSQSSASSYPQAIANMRKRSIAGSV